RAAGDAQISAIRHIPIGSLDMLMFIYAENVVVSPSKCAASGLVLAHNHPSSNIKPSQADLTITLDW
ncbi:MAG: JAB domain-containing protein, partial [Sphingobacterium sp.]